MKNDKSLFRAGAATRDISPLKPAFLYGYPHVPRYSTGVHDPLLSSALHLSDGATDAVIISNDIIFVSKASAGRVRERIAAQSGIPVGNILISATHTHSGPMTLDYISNEADSTVPKTDMAYVLHLENELVAAALEAVQNSRPAEAGFALADGSGVGTNRRNPKGPADPEVPVLMIRSVPDGKPLACMLVCSMHPTVLHEDSTLVSGDFPAMARDFLHCEVLGPHCPVLHHTGPAGDQSPRHVTRENTFAEAERLGAILGRSVASAIERIEYSRDLRLQCAQTRLDLPRRTLPSVGEAEANRGRAREYLKRLRTSAAPRQEIRTAEVDWFGAEETLTLARAAADGRLEAAYQACLPAEIQVVRIGPWKFVGWQGEIFVEYALAVKARRSNTFVISLANGELQGYIATREAHDQHFYEAGNSLFEWTAGEMIVARTLELLATLHD